MMLMNKLKKCRRALGVLMVVPTLLVGLNAFALSQDQAAKSAQARQRELTEVPLAKEVRHQLIMLPYYTVFDNLQFRIKNNDTVVLLGQVVWPVLKSDAGNVVRRIEGVKKVENDIEVLPLSPFDNMIRRREYRAIYGTIGLDRYALQAVPPVHIIVKNGNVTLVGVVADTFDKNIAGIEANAVPNVFHVTNDLHVERNG